MADPLPADRLRSLLALLAAEAAVIDAQGYVVEALGDWTALHAIDHWIAPLGEAGTNAHDALGSCSVAAATQANGALRAVLSGERQACEVLYRWGPDEGAPLRRYWAVVGASPGGSALVFHADVTDLIEHAWLSGDSPHADASLAAVARLAGGVAHDLNNFLTTVFGYCDMLGMELDPEDALAGDVGQIRLAAERTADLTTKLLAFSRRQVLRPRPYDLSELVRDAERTLTSKIARGAVEVQFELASTRTVQVDKDQLQHVILALAVNAVEAMPEGGPSPCGRPTST